MADINLGVGGANSAVAGGYDIANSLKFEADNTERMTHTLADAAFNQTWTISLWYKTTEINQLKWLYGNGQTRFWVESDNTWGIRFYSGVTSYNIRASNLLRDTAAFYHLVVAVDTTQATAADRVKLYINGVQVTSFSVQDTIPQNATRTAQHANAFNIGRWTGGAGGEMSGYMAEFHAIDGQQLAASDFGEFDSDTGIWKPKAYTGSYGTYGSYLDFEDAADLGADDSGNNLDYTLYNITSADQATDTPTNNFATNNPLAQNDMNPLQGATQWTHNNASDWESSISTIGVTKGKWYFEASMDSTGNMIGIIANNGITDSLNCMDSYPGDRLDTQNAGIGYHGAGNVFQNDGFTSGMPSYGGGNIISCALDMDNGYVYFARNGSWINSGDPTSGSSGTGGWAVYDTSDIQFFATSIYSTADNIKCNWGGFRIYSISSAETDANGYGTFEYAPPSGYYALCSKNLAQYG